MVFLKVIKASLKFGLPASILSIIAWNLIVGSLFIRGIEGLAKILLIIILYLVIFILLAKNVNRVYEVLEENNWPH